MFIIVEDAIWKMVKLLIMSSLLKDLPIARFDHASIVPRGLILIYSSSSLSSISSVLSFSFFFQLFSSSLGSLSFPFFFFGFSCPTAFSCFFFFYYYFVVASQLQKEQMPIAYAQYIRI